MKLHDAFKKHFSTKKINNLKGKTYQTEEKSRDRLESRLYRANDIFDKFVNLFFNQKGMKILESIISTRMKYGIFNADNISTLYYMSSAELTDKKLANVIKQHQFIENNIHWRMDVAMRKDDLKIRRDNTP